MHETVFDTKQVVLSWQGDASACRMVASDDGWAPFAEVATALLASGEAVPDDLSGLRVPNVAVARAEAHASGPLRAFWEEHLGQRDGEGPIGYWSFLRPGTDDGALMPDRALRRWLEVGRASWAEEREAQALVDRRLARHRAAQALVDATPRSVRWDGPAPVDAVAALPFAGQEPGVSVLDAVEARAANFDQMLPDEPVTHVARESVMLALAAAGVLDPPDDGRRLRALEGRPALTSWRQAALDWADALAVAPELAPPGCPHPLASPVALDWFRHGPYAGELSSPSDFLRWHLQSWQEEEREGPGFLDLYARHLSGRVIWRTGVAGLQQLHAAGTPERRLPWAARCTVRAAVCTKAGGPALGVALAASLAAREPANWHGWMELGVALAGVVTGGHAATNPFRSEGRALHPGSLAGGARASLRRAVERNPSLRGASVIQGVEHDLEDNRWFHDQPPVPLSDFPGALLAGVDGAALAAAFARLPGPVRRYVLSGDFAAETPVLAGLAADPG